jgi:hypothetical protein
MCINKTIDESACITTLSRVHFYDEQVPVGGAMVNACFAALHIYERPRA